MKRHNALSLLLSIIIVLSFIVSITTEARGTCQLPPPSLQQTGCDHLDETFLSAVHVSRNSIILLRRTANGQPAMLMYPYGTGKVIVTSMYSDWAYGHSQASKEEIALVKKVSTYEV